MDLLDYVKSIDKTLKEINISLKILAGIEDKSAVNKKDKPRQTTDVWVVEPYSTCLTSMPPQYVSRISHYHDPNYVDIDCIKRIGYNHIFYTKEEAVEYCKVSLGTKYEIIDCIVPETIVIGPDYE